MSFSMLSNSVMKKSVYFDELQLSSDVFCIV